ncbi:prefoldin subunit 6 [Thrips palmi]|uniref:Probable prefoldin subunit 6 n=1 Tax=Thrips palmi TaxID=161013 RepID=A0A6P9AAP2_THRPL|nr:prefoldin subunit 6 [Thrips palmi]
MAEELHKKLQQEVENFQALQKQYQKTLSVRQQLGGQLFENETVKTELDLVKKDQEVYKLIGPVLIKQDIEEALQNVNKRMDYIKGELKRVDDTITDMEKKQDSQRDVLNKLQQQYQKAQLVAATKN